MFIAGFVTALVLFGPLFSVGRGKILNCGIQIGSTCIYERYERVSLIEKVFVK